MTVPPSTESGADEDLYATQAAFDADLLPNETLAAIFSFITPSELVTLTCASHRFNAVAERILYSSIAVSDTVSESHALPYRTLRLCDSIVRRPQFYDVVKHLGIRWHAEANSDKGVLARPLREVACWRLNALLLGPANLTPGGTSHAVETAIRGCVLPLLQYCSLGAESAKNTRPYGSVLNDFLAPSAGVLRHLKLYDHRGSINLPPGALPQLISFRGCANAAASLLPGNSVSYLALTGQDSDVTHDNLPRMAQGRVPLRYLDLSGMSARPVLLRSVAGYFPALEGIKVRLALRHTLHFALVLSTFPSLTYLDLSPTGVDGAAQRSAEEELCLQWRQVCQPTSCSSPLLIRRRHAQL
ncbi:hypothetical protein BD626DRAFT_488661 [Schizophyllum amplum]|uniref:F-box domain-containing protein n=1 Tax=Schizophyllum amplum TaxID=97359 RepID=A0A550CKR2_9AGAR|nr:hypothetical protein BD626DRAFT_488661 [Auriculariopsis ampla]